ncbi:GNAT family N-acetyltransferase [Mycobacterium angelicum]|uniref:GNAT family N-acetyltransferase n=1 Tax=Mycobacterium angelicum TaxID=470074 RepID=A0A1X0A5E0_MYCAN|nr:GNAT family N-acetyltransferase [Mycobacterium angelicum]ORA25267.1 GNAT family N-acetyltransferase [Mycobacterium angelicum]
MKSRDIKIRQAKPADFAKVAAMHYPVWRQSWSGMLSDYELNMLAPPQHWAAQLYPQTLSRRGWIMWLAESGGQVIGMAMYGPDLTNPRDLHIDALYVMENDQRRGIGGRLLNKALHADPTEDVILWAANKNEKARRFYEKKNFELDGRSFDWRPLPGVSVPHVGYRLRRR